MTRWAFPLGLLAMVVAVLGCAQPRKAAEPAAAAVPPDDAPAAAARAGIQARLAALGNLTMECTSDIDNVALPSVSIEAPLGVWKKSREVFRYCRGNTRFDFMDTAIAIPPFEGTLKEIRSPSGMTITFPQVRIGERAEFFTTPMNELSLSELVIVFEDQALGLRAVDRKEWNMPEVVARMQLRAGEQGRVEGIERERPTIRYFFNPARGYALEQVVVESDSSRQTTIAEDFRTVGSLQLPYKLMRLTEWRRGGETGYTLMQRRTATVTRYQVNDPANQDLSLFARPIPH